MSCFWNLWSNRSEFDIHGRSTNAAIVTPLFSWLLLLDPDCIRTINKGQVGIAFGKDRFIERIAERSRVTAFACRKHPMVPGRVHQLRIPTVSELPLGLIRSPSPIYCNIHVRAKLLFPLLETLCPSYIKVQ